jgi:hypothetical protein
MENSNQLMAAYIKPALRVVEIGSYSNFCTSPAPGGSEGTGEEPLSAPSVNDFDYDSF